MSKFLAKPYHLKNSIQHYAWGTKNEDAFIPQLLGTEAEKDKPYAELWMGVHPNAPSIVVDSKKEISLQDLIHQNPSEVLGVTTACSFENKLPFLFKVLSAAEALSIQAHPSKSQAEELHRIDPVNYPDDNHKPEIAIALDKLTALVGFRSYTEIVSTLKRYPEMSKFIGTEMVNGFVLVESSEIPQKKERLKELYATLLANASKKPTALLTSLNNLEIRLIHMNEDLDEREQLFLKLIKQYGNDVGLYSLFLLNLVHLEKGQGVFLEAGVPHAYLKGNIIECMANSDNVVRAGLTPKFKDMMTLVNILTFESGEVNVLDFQEQAQVVRYPSLTPEFAVSRINMKQGNMLKQSCASIQIIINLAGRAAIIWQDGSIECARGCVIMIPSALKGYNILANTDVELFRVEVPVNAQD